MSTDEDNYSFRLIEDGRRAQTGLDAWRIRRVADPFGIPWPHPWEVFQLKPCKVPTCGGACWRVVASFDTEAEALAAYPNAQPWPVIGGAA